MINSLSIPPNTMGSSSSSLASPIATAQMIENPLQYLIPKYLTQAEVDNLDPDLKNILSEQVIREFITQNNLSGKDIEKLQQHHLELLRSGKFLKFMKLQKRNIVEILVYSKEEARNLLDPYIRRRVSLPEELTWLKFCFEEAKGLKENQRKILQDEDYLHFAERYGQTEALINVTERQASILCKDSIKVLIFSELIPLNAALEMSTSEVGELERYMNMLLQEVNVNHEELETRLLIKCLEITAVDLEGLYPGLKDLLSKPVIREFITQNKLSVGDIKKLQWFHFVLLQDREFLKFMELQKRSIREILTIEHREGRPNSLLYPAVRTLIALPGQPPNNNQLTFEDATKLERYHLELIQNGELLKAAKSSGISITRQIELLSEQHSRLSVSTATTTTATSEGSLPSLSSSSQTFLSRSAQHSRLSSRPAATTTPATSAHGPTQ